MISASSACLSLLLVAVAYFGASQCEKSPLSYMPTRFNINTEQEINWIVDKIDSGKWGSDIEKVSETLKQAVQAALQLTYDDEYEYPSDDTTGVIEFKSEENGIYWLYETLRSMQRLSDDEVGSTMTCTNKDVLFLIDIMDRKFGGIGGLEHHEQPTKSLTLEYLGHYAPKFYSQCLDRLNGDFGRYMKKFNPTTETRLAGYFRIPEGQLNLNSAGLRDACCDLRVRFAGSFDVYNMARILVPNRAKQLALTPQFHILNDYSRMCIGLPCVSLDGI